MHFPKYWARVTVSDRDDRIVMVGWSDVSKADAEAHARTRAGRILGWIAALGNCDKAEDEAARDLEAARYLYGEKNPLREEIIEERDDGTPAHVVVTRNRYGALVLNTQNVMFIDVDDVKGPSRTGFLNLIFGKKKDESLLRQEAQKRVIVETIEKTENLKSVLYRTRAGFRILVLSRLFDPESAEALAVLQAFGSDPLYVKLTRSQKCFRARLSPKPWRCGIGRPPAEYPRESADTQREFAGWLAEYRENAGDYAVCESLGEYGSGSVLPAASAVRARHDAAVLSPGRALA